MAKRIDPKIAARMRAGEKQPAPVTATDAAHITLPTEDELVPSRSKLKQTAGGNKRKIISALIVLGIVALIVGGYFLISALGLHGATKAAGDFSNR